MGPTDRPEPAAGGESIADEGSTVVKECCADEDAAMDEMSACVQRRPGEEECADAEADEMAASMQRRVDALPGKAHESEPFTIFRFFLKGEDRAADALIDAAWAMQNVYNDLFLLENQLPFFVVERFYDIATGGLGRDYLVTNLLAKYLTMDTPQDAATARPPDGEILHLLHLYYHWFLPPEDRTNDSGGSGTSSKEEDEAWDEWLAKPVHERVPWLMPPATELQDAGVTFRAKRSPRSLVDVTFSRREGALEIPTVGSYTNRAMLANLVAYEQSRGRWELQRVASYVLLMASVADGRRDVELLQRAGVLARGDDETAAFYAHLCPPPESVNNCYDELYRHVREYRGRSWNRHRAVLVHDYFSNPWTSMSAAAAVLLLVLTVVQTVYTVLPYYHPS
uniref:Uncharacterized protein n=1 Tax=Oryza brachyantha TaxID=4533 RepID=J3MUU2_ORYBR